MGRIPQIEVQAREPCAHSRINTSILSGVRNVVKGARTAQQRFKIPVGSIEFNGCACDLTGSACGACEGLRSQECLVHAGCHIADSRRYVSEY